MISTPIPVDLMAWTLQAAVGLVCGFSSGGDEPDDFNLNYRMGYNPAFQMV
ncbi:MAG: hypothetical protein VCC01_14320 [Candidatus Hydrogenedentota bacterium]